MAVPNIGVMTALTMDSMMKELADNVTNNIVLLHHLNKAGNIKTFSGGEYIREELEFPDSAYDDSVKSYSGYDTLPIVANQGFDAARYQMTQYAASVLVSGSDMLQNSGREQIISLLAARINRAKTKLRDKLDNDLNGDGTGNSGKDINGLANLVATVPTNTVGGINASTWSFWQNKKFSGVTDGGAAVSAGNIQTYMTSLFLDLVRGTDAPNLILAGSAYFKLYTESLLPIQRVMDSASATAGFTSLSFAGGGKTVPVVMGGGVGSHVTSATMRFLNTKYLRLRPHVDMNFKRIGDERVPLQQDARAQFFGWAGNLTCNNRSLQGVLFA